MNFNFKFDIWFFALLCIVLGSIALITVGLLFLPVDLQKPIGYSVLWFSGIGIVGGLCYQALFFGSMKDSLITKFNIGFYGLVCLVASTVTAIVHGHGGSFMSFEWFLCAAMALLCAVATAHEYSDHWPLTPTK